MENKELENKIRAQFNLSEDEVIPEFVYKFCPVEKVVLTEEEKKWVNKVAKKLE